MLILSGPPVNQIASVVVCGTNELFTCFVVNTLHIPWITLLFTLKSVIFGSKSHSYSPCVRADHTLIHPKNVRSHSYSPQKWGGGVQMAHLLYDKIINFIMKVCNTVHTCKFKTPIKHFLDFLLGHHTDEFGTCFLR